MAYHGYTDLSVGAKAFPPDPTDPLRPELSRYAQLQRYWEWDPDSKTWKQVEEGPLLSWGPSWSFTGDAWNDPRVLELQGSDVERIGRQRNVWVYGARFYFAEDGSYHPYVVAWNW